MKYVLIISVLFIAGSLIFLGGKDKKPCLIKGNINTKGVKIYHSPDDPNDLFYEKTQIDESTGERWFCSVEEAIKAGWRAPK